MSKEKAVAEVAEYMGKCIEMNRMEIIDFLSYREPTQSAEDIVNIFLDTLLSKYFMKYTHQGLLGIISSGAIFMMKEIGINKMKEDAAIKEAMLLEFEVIM